MLGYNYRMTDLQGAVGLVQLKKLHRFIKERDHWAAYYRAAFAEIDWLQTPPESINGQHAYQAFVCYVDPQTAPLPRNEIMEILNSKGINTRPGTHTVTNLDYYKDRYGFTENDFPVASACERQTLAIPLHNRMNQEDFDYIIHAMHLIAQSEVCV
jgi:dTDP-4-amino-4,6-dideoxygalactose transaminase